MADKRKQSNVGHAMESVTGGGAQDQMGGRIMEGEVPGQRIPKPKQASLGGNNSVQHQPADKATGLPPGTERDDTVLENPEKQSGG